MCIGILSQCVTCCQCRPEYKIPGLYVVDSIIRQSRHQFGPAKDVFGPRFLRNIAVLFQSVLSCPSSDIVGFIIVVVIALYRMHMLLL